jgi:hypothetical protein
MLRRLGSKPLLLAGLAAAGYYAYNKMSPQQRKDLVDKGKKMVDGLSPQLKGVLGKVGLS